MKLRYSHFSTLPDTCVNDVFLWPNHKRQDPRAFGLLQAFCQLPHSNIIAKFISVKSIHFLKKLNAFFSAEKLTGWSQSRSSFLGQCPRKGSSKLYNLNKIYSAILAITRISYKICSCYLLG